jgi:cysteinyl-tRNA synthetase
VSLRIYNTLSRQKEPFVPLVPGQVSMYVCGITPYDVSHIGHARSALVFDVIARYLAHAGYRVNFVKNYTDVDDKIITRANQLKILIAELTERYIKAYEADMTRLGVQPPTTAPRATAHIPEMVTLIKELVAKGLAYVVGGDVYFEVVRFPTYGRLGQEPRGAPRWRAGRRERAEARPPGFRALESGEARRAVVAEPLGSRPAGLAHRVLGDGDEVPRRDDRSPRRW